LQQPAAACAWPELALNRAGVVSAGVVDPALDDPLSKLRAIIKLEGFEELPIRWAFLRQLESVAEASSFVIISKKQV
jgi:hypothetical protein